MTGLMGEAWQAPKGADQRRVVGERARSADDCKGGGGGGNPMHIRNIHKMRA